MVQERESKIHYRSWKVKYSTGAGKKNTVQELESKIQCRSWKEKYSKGVGK
jgi:hypothetical protein